MDISNLLQVQMNEVLPPIAVETDTMNSKDSVTSVKVSQLVSNDEMLFYQRMFANDIAQVRFRRLHCTACDSHIGSAPSEAANMQEHPILKTLLCSACRDFYGDGKFEQGDDATDMFCRWCANGGNLYCCSYCSNTFCDKCIKRNFESDVRNKIEADEKWKCFVCDPTDLYTLRAICRAILQHVKTLARILKADRSMNAKEIESKMELDDSKCCSGRRSRRRRRESSSDDSSQRSRSPSQKRIRKNHSWSITRRRKSSQNERSGYTVLNGTSRFIPIAPRFVLQEMVPSTAKYRNDDDEIPAPLLHCEQTMIEGENETVTPQGVVLPTNSQSKIPDSILYNSAISLNPISSQNIVRGPLTRGCKVIPMRPLRKINSLPPGKTPQVIRRLTAHPARPTTPMVAIPSVTSSTSNTNTPPPVISADNSSAQRTNYLRCKSNLTTEPNVIDLESDTEDFVILESRSIPNATTNNCEKNTNDASTQWEDITSSLLPAQLRRKIFEETLDNPIVAIDKLLNKLRERLKYDMDSVIDTPDTNDIHSCRMKIKIINQNIDEIVNELAVFNNSMIRQYQPWKELKTAAGTDEDDTTKSIVLKNGERSSKYIPLHMECVRDSGSDMEDGDDDDDDDDVVDDIEYVLKFSERLAKFGEKDVFDKSTHAQVKTEDKAVQAYDTVTMDYDKAIGYSLLMRADYNFEQKCEVFKPVVIHDKFFGKYEEQYISYLQRFEEIRNFQDEESYSEKTSRDDMSLTEIIDADIAGQRATESFKGISDATHSDTCARKSEGVYDRERDGNGEIEMTTVIDLIDTPAIKLVENRVEAVDNEVPNEPDSSPVEKSPSQKAKHAETVIAVRALIEEKSNDTKVIDKWKNTEDDDECTILE